MVPMIAMISDVDEMIDFSDPGRRSELLEKMQQSFQTAW